MALSCVRTADAIWEVEGGVPQAEGTGPARTPCFGGFSWGEGGRRLVSPESTHPPPLARLWGDFGDGGVWGGGCY